MSLVYPTLRSFPWSVCVCMWSDYLMVSLCIPLASGAVREIHICHATYFAVSLTFAHIFYAHMCNWSYECTFLREKNPLFIHNKYISTSQCIFCWIVKYNIKVQFSVTTRCRCFTTQPPGDTVCNYNSKDAFSVDCSFKSHHDLYFFPYLFFFTCMNFNNLWGFHRRIFGQQCVVSLCL